MNTINKLLRKFYNFYSQLKLKNKSFTLIASNCNGGVILSDLNLPFNSPFINLWLPPQDFLMFCDNMPYYLNQKLRFTKEKDIDYPVAMLDDVKIYFQHYRNEEEAAYFWNKRKHRIDMNHVFILFTDRDGCTYDDLQHFERLNYKHKAVLVNKQYPELKSSVYIPGFEQEKCVGMCMEYMSRFTYKRYLDAFDYVSWFNSDI